MSIISIGIQAQQIVIENTDGTKKSYPLETFLKATFISEGASQDYMVVKTTSGDKTEIPVNQVKSVIIKNRSNGHEYVDLGLPSGLKWATCNVGATTPEDYGDYFAWGETEPYYTEGHSQDNPCTSWITGKTGYNWASYRLCKGSSLTMTKYCTSSSYGTVDNKTTLELADDAAYKNWGGSWRMPTKAEQDELLTKCTWTWTTQGNVKGYKVTGPNGNSIFLPAAGYRGEGSLDSAGSGGYYWSSSLSTSYSGSAYYLDFGSSNVSSSDHGRSYGQSVRAVCP